MKPRSTTNGRQAHPAAVASRPEVVSLSAFKPTSIASFLDGGTRRMEGTLDGRSAVVRYDGQRGSPTEGQIFLLISGKDERIDTSVPKLAELRAVLATLLKTNPQQLHADAYNALYVNITGRLINAGAVQAIPPVDFARVEVTRIRNAGYPPGGFALEGTIDGKSVLASYTPERNGIRLNPGVFPEEPGRTMSATELAGMLVHAPRVDTFSTK